MQKRNLGNSNLEVSALGLGRMGIYGYCAQEKMLPPKFMEGVSQ